MALMTSTCPILIDYEIISHFSIDHVANTITLSKKISVLHMTGLVFFYISALIFQSVAAWSGTVTFYNNRWHDKSGGTYKYTIDDSQQCINLSCYNDRATSAKWKNLVKWGAFDGKSRIAFYTGKDCTGTVRHWEIEDPGYFPGNFFLDGIDNDISSFMIWQFSKEAKSTTLPCPWDFKCCLG